jgi:hypothetical protein
MKFIVDRASAWRDESKPCESAVFFKKDYLDRNMYLVELNTLNELIDFVKTYDRIIIDSGEFSNKEGMPQITIYDDCIE